MRNGKDGLSRGQALVEFALVLPILLMIIFGIIDGGRLIFTNNAVSNAARNAARVAVVNQSATGAQTCDTTAGAFATGCAVSSAVGIVVEPGDVSVTYRNFADTGNCADGTPANFQIGCLAVVTVSADYQPLTPVLRDFVGVVTVSATTKMPIERVCASSC